MEHTFKIEKELKIMTENIVDCVLSCEAGGFDYWVAGPLFFCRLG